MCDKEEQTLKAKLAQHAERYDDMVNSMKSVTEMRDELSKEERNLLSVAYKNVVGARRSAWRVIMEQQKVEENEKKDDHKQRLELEVEKINSDNQKLQAKVHPPARQNASIFVS